MHDNSSYDLGARHTSCGAEADSNLNTLTISSRIVSSVCDCHSRRCSQGRISKCSLWKIQRLQPRRRRLYLGTVHQPCQSSQNMRRPSLLSLPCVVGILVCVLGTVRAAAVGVGTLSLGCTGLCAHGTCLYSAKAEEAKATVACHCQQGWGGQHCNVPCSRSCGSHGQCVFVGEQQVCLCQLGYVGLDCSQPSYDVITVFGLAKQASPDPQADAPPLPLSSAAPAPLGVKSKAGAKQEPPAAEAKSKRSGTGETALPTSSFSSAAAAFNSSKSKAAGRELALDARAGGATSELPAPSTSSSSPPLSQWEIDGTSLPLFPTASAANLPGVAGVENPREQVERNVELGSSQCMHNFVCLNGGRCVAGSFGGFRCLCRPPFFGTFCDSACPKPCYNGGRCLKLRHRERPAAAQSGAADADARSNLLPASLDPVAPGYQYVYKCVCPQQFHGEQCERKLQT